MKIDTRPQKGAWAPGDYMGKCDRCGQEYQGDKRARNCAPCAYGDLSSLKEIAGREVLFMLESADGYKSVEIHGEYGLEKREKADGAFTVIVLAHPAGKGK